MSAKSRNFNHLEIPMGKITEQQLEDFKKLMQENVQPFGLEFVPSPFIDNELIRLRRFKEYWDELYGKGLEIANWHMNGQLEDFDNFYDSAMDEYDKEVI